MIDTLSIADVPSLCGISSSLSVVELLLLRYMKLSTHFRTAEIARSHLKHMFFILLAVM